MFSAQSTARGYIRAEYTLLIYLSITLHTSHLTSTTIFLRNDVKEKEREKREKEMERKQLFLDDLHAW